MTGELVRYAETEAPAGTPAAADALEALVADPDAGLPEGVVALLRPLPAAVRAGHTISLAEAPRVRVCRVCGELFLADDVPGACPRCEAPALTFHEELPAWYLGPADRGAILAALAAGPRHLARALHDRTDEALARPPAPGEWSAVQALEHLLYSEELLATRIDRLLTEDQLLAGGKGGEEMQRRPACGAVVAAARGLAVDGDEGGSVRAQPACPGHEAVGEQVRVDAVQEDVEPTGAGNAVVIGQEATQEGEMALAPGGDVVEVVAGSDAGADDEQQNLGQRMRHPPRLAWVLDDRKMVEKAAQARLVAEAVHVRAPESSHSPK